MTIFDEADEVAAEHIRWCLGRWMTLRGIVEAVGAEYRPQDGADGVHDLLAQVWLLNRANLARISRGAARLPRWWR